MAKHTLKSCGAHTARFLKYVWPFYNIMHERVDMCNWLLKKTGLWEENISDLKGKESERLYHLKAYQSYFLGGCLFLLEII